MCVCFFKFIINKKYFEKYDGIFLGLGILLINLNYIIFVRNVFTLMDGFFFFIWDRMFWIDFHIKKMFWCILLFICIYVYSRNSDFAVFCYLKMCMQIKESFFLENIVIPIQRFIEKSTF